jgi:ribonuclease HII
MLSRRFKDDAVIEIGIDEAGRGSFWGPIMAGAVIIPDETAWSDKQHALLSQLRDSKKISPKKREKLANDIKELIPNTAVGIVSVQEINDNGITWANMEAFRRAVINLNLEDLSKCRLVIDGVLSINKWEGEQELVVEGDGKYLAIAAASILAKVEHDFWIQNYCKNNPSCNDKYDLLKCKGYGTANHREGIRIYGAHELHRVLYIQNWLPGSIKPRKMTTAKQDKCLINFTV